VHKTAAKYHRMPEKLEKNTSKNKINNTEAEMAVETGKHWNTSISSANVKNRAALSTHQIS